MITGYSQPHRFRKLAAAPLGLLDQLIELIDHEAERKRRGQKAAIMAKVNSLNHPRLIKALYRAAKAGVKIQLNVRGICGLRPGLPGLSENISVVSIVDRFLEHSRIFYFHHGGEGLVYISSADWLRRNLDRRVELMVPVEDPASRDRLVEILGTYFKDTVKGRRLLPDGSYERVRPAGRRKSLRSQEALYDDACAAIEDARQARPTVFEPHRAPSAET
jgi:polyphosphate kinase